MLCCTYYILCCIHVSSKTLALVSHQIVASSVAHLPHLCYVTVHLLSRSSWFIFHQIREISLNTIPPHWTSENYTQIHQFPTWVQLFGMHSSLSHSVAQMCKITRKLHAFRQQICMLDEHVWCSPPIGWKCSELISITFFFAFALRGFNAHLNRRSLDC